MRLCVVLLPVTFLACEPALPLGEPAMAMQPATEPDSGTPAQSSRVASRAVGEHMVSTIDASDSKQWTAVDLDEGAREVPFALAQWDLALSRFHIRARGGASGNGAVEVAVLADVSFEAVTAVSASAFRVDQPDGDDANSDLDTVFESPESWYRYDVSTHVLTPRKLVYVIKTDAQRLFKIQVEDYYDEAGTPGFVTMRWQPL